MLEEYLKITFKLLMQPLVSVLMTCYNREEYIGEAIESVLASTYKNFELIIVDDCSIDETVIIAKNMKSLIPGLEFTLMKKILRNFRIEIKQLV